MHVVAVSRVRCTRDLLRKALNRKVCIEPLGMNRAVASV